MKNTFLLPNRYKVYGWIIFLLFSAIGLACMYLEFKIPGFQVYSRQSEGFLDFNDYNLTDEFALTGVVIGLLMVAFAKEKNEDEFIAYLRLKSWQWSVLASYVILIVIVFTVYGGAFFGILFYNIFTVLLVFIAKFNFSLYQLKKAGSTDEK
ncbi:MAG: hypothetical protein H7202_02035 [Pedobacter sp.]|nr:hypothetical protein [Pedobacter sp.]